MGYIRNCITSTTGRLLLLSVMCFMAQHIQAQGSLDDARYNRFTLMHDGTGNINTADYGIGYNSYSNDVVATNLMNFRTSFKTRLTLEEPKVEMIERTRMRPSWKVPLSSDPGRPTPRMFGNSWKLWRS